MLSGTARFGGRTANRLPDGWQGNGEMRKRMAQHGRFRHMRVRAARLAGQLRFEHSILLLLAVVVGVAAGYGALGFRGLISAWGLLAFGTTEEELIAGTVHLPWWHMLAVPIVGGCLVSLILRYALSAPRPQTVSEVIEAAALRDGRMSFRTGLSNAVLNATALGFGSSVGREGPVVHLGASIASGLAQVLHLSPAMMRTLVGCGVASAVAASFNAPIAGVLFALEVVIGHYALHAFAPIVIAGVAGTVVSRIHLGNFPAFTLPELQIVSTWEFPAFALLGLGGGVVAIAFMHWIFLSGDCREKWLRLPEWSLPPLGGLLVGLVAIGVPEVIGVGYEGTDNALKGNYALEALLLFLAAKILLTGLCITLRFGTGVFSPSLFIGAMFGGAFGVTATALFPELASDTGVYAIVGMGAVASAVLGAPISTILIVFELTGDYEVTLAVMIGAALASTLTHFAYGPSFFLKQLARRGLSLEAGKASHLLKSTGVKAVMLTDFATAQRRTPLSEVRHLLIAQGGGKLPVTDDAGGLLGVIALADLPSEAFDRDRDGELTAEQVARTDPPVVYAGDTLEAGLRLLERTGEHQIPVLSDPESRTVIGMLDHEDVLRAYTTALLDSHGRLETTR